MENLTSHPLMQPTPANLMEWPNQIEMIHHSLNAIRSLRPTAIYRGHAEPVASVDAMREKILQKHSETQTKIVKVLETGPGKLFQINQRVSTFRTPVEQFIQIFETNHHLNCLMRAGKVRKLDSTFSLS